MTSKEGLQLKGKMLKKTGRSFWTFNDLKEYLDAEREIYTRLDTQDNTVKIDGWCSIEDLEAILIALYNQRGEMRG